MLLLRLTFEKITTEPLYVRMMILKKKDTTLLLKVQARTKWANGQFLSTARPVILCVILARYTSEIKTGDVEMAQA